VKRLIFLALLLACGTAQAAAKWVSLYKDASGARTAVDVSSIRIDGDIRHASVKMVYAPQTQHGVGEDRLKWVRYSLNLDAFDCGKTAHRNEALTTYFTDGSSDRVAANSLPTPWELVAPDSVGGVVMKFVCAWKRK
jgi:hypothetical protein